VLGGSGAFSTDPTPQPKAQQYSEIKRDQKRHQKHMENKTNTNTLTKHMENEHIDKTKLFYTLRVMSRQDVDRILVCPVAARRGTYLQCGVPQTVLFDLYGY